MIFIAASENGGLTMSAEQVKCQECHYWPTEKGTSGDWRMCRKFFHLARKDDSCKDGKRREDQ